MVGCWERFISATRRSIPLYKQEAQRICSSLPQAKATTTHPATLLSVFDYCEYTTTSDRDNNSYSKKVECFLYVKKYKAGVSSYLRAESPCS